MSDGFDRRTQQLKNLQQSRQRIADYKREVEALTPAGLAMFTVLGEMPHSSLLEPGEAFWVVARVRPHLYREAADEIQAIIDQGSFDATGDAALAVQVLRDKARLAEQNNENRLKYLRHKDVFDG
jgi:hypothetical protein